MRKKIVDIIVCMLLISSTTTMVLFSDTVKVEASGGGQQGSSALNLPYDFVWSVAENFSNVIHNVNWSQNGGNGIPKGRAWATAGENYTIDEILEPNMNGTDKPCGLTGYTKLPIGYISGEHGLVPRTNNPKQYSSKIVIQDYNLTIYNGTNITYIPYSEVFPMGVGCGWEYQIDDENFSFDELPVKVISFDKNEYIANHLNVTCSLLNSFDEIVGPVIYLNSSDSVPENQDCIFILNEEPASEAKIENLSFSWGCILIENSTKSYSFNCSKYNIPFSKINGMDSNFSTVLEQIRTGSDYFVDNLKQNQTLVFSNYTNYLCDCIYIVKSEAEEDYSKLIIRGRKYCKHCKALILVSYDNHTHIMTHTMRDWNWFGLPFYTNRFPLPIFSINGTMGKEIMENNETVRISGFLNQTYHKQENNMSGVISHNVIAYRNISNSHNNATIILNNRMDGWWGETPGDAGAAGAILLGIAKYIKDNNITPKYNLAFLFTTGEEYGMRGAQHFVDSHKEGYNFKYWIGFEQLGFNNSTAPQEQTLFLNTNFVLINNTLNNTLSEIGKITNYSGRINYSFSTHEYTPREHFSGAEDYVWKDICDTILIVKSGKGDGKWLSHHQVGENFSRGDCLNDMDRDDVNLTFELAWNITKYFCVNPDCCNNSISYFLFDNNTDGKNDSVSVNFSIDTIMPQDRIWVKAALVNVNHPRYRRYSSSKTYVITSSGIQDTLNVTLPKKFPEGNYKLEVHFFNSTGEIDRKCSSRLGDYWADPLYANFKNTSETFYLYPPNQPPSTPQQPSGETSVYTCWPYEYTTSSTDPEGKPIRYKWRYDTYLCTVYELFWSWPNVSTKTIGWGFPGTYNISARAMDTFGLKSNWSQNLTVNASVWSGSPVPWETTKLLADFSQSTLAVNQQTTCDGLAEGVTVSTQMKSSLNWTWDFGDGSDPTYDENASHSYSQVGNYTVNLSIRNSEGYYFNCTKNITVLVLNAYFIVGGDIQPNGTTLFTDASAGLYTISSWVWDFGDGNVSYDQNASHTFAAAGTYNVTLTVNDSQNNTHAYRRTVVVETIAPTIIYTIAEPDTVGFGFPVTIAADILENESGIKEVWVTITAPDNTSVNLTMALNTSSEYDYTCTFNDTWQHGIYFYDVYATDWSNNMNGSGGIFTVTANATLSICTVKDNFESSEFINLTDPPGDPSPSLGYELIDDGTVLHLWNQYDSYYVNTSSGVQLTNHKDEYWSRNVLMLGYYNNDQWNLLYRTDELTGFTREIESDDATFVHVTLWKDLTYAGYLFRLAIRYHLGVYDNDLTVIPSIKNIGSSSIPYVLGFGWELKDIQINMTTEGDYILIDQQTYLLNQTLDNSYTSLNDTVFYLMEDVTGSQIQSLYLRWNPNLNYKLVVKSRSGQQNAPVTLFIRIGMLAAGQQKHTLFQWYDASQETYYFNGFDGNEAWETEAELMTDGDVETFASTSIYPDVELCNGNTCEGEDQGEILKVEVRVFGYHEGEQGNITLVPVFGEDRGENYTFVTSGQPAWSPWFDITDDENHEGEGWSWSEVAALDCHVISSDVEDATLFCSMVELRVTYNTAPTVSNPSPAYGVNGVGLQPWVNITVSDPDEDSMDITWYSNSTPSLLTLRPNGNGSITQLSKYPGSTMANYQCVDEAVANDADYVYWSGTTWKKDTYTLEDHGDASGAIHAVTVHVRCGFGGIGSYPGVLNKAKIVLKSGTSYYYGDEVTLSSIFTYHTQSWLLNPATGAAWDWSAVDALEAGVDLTGDLGGSSTCSQVYVVVTYVNPSTWLQFGSNSSVCNGVYRQRFLNASVNGQWWYWTVKADDGTLSTWSSVYKFYTGYQSKIENTGEIDISGYLLMQVQYYNESLESWIVDNDTINETTSRIINSSCQLGLDTIFNGHVRASDLMNGPGLYRVYAAFQDPEGNILKTNDETDLEAWWQFNKT